LRRGWGRGCGDWRERRLRGGHFKFSLQPGRELPASSTFK